MRKFVWGMVKYTGIFILMAYVAMTFGACKDACKKTYCLNDAFCHEGECFCEKWYSGEHCELQFNRNYAGTYYGSYTEVNGVQSRAQDSLVLNADLIIPNRLNAEQGFYLEFENDSALTIPLQTVRTPLDTYNIEGEGTYDIDVIALRYTKTFETIDERDRIIEFFGQKALKEEEN